MVTGAGFEKARREPKTRFAARLRSGIGGTTHGFLLSKGTYATLDVPGSTGTVALGINPSGQIVGTYDDAAFQAHGFLLDKGTYTTFDPPGSTFTQPLGINPSGDIVGFYRDAVGTYHGFRASPVP